MITPQLITTILDQYSLSLSGIHGVAHWARVLQNGARLADHSGADLKIVQLFAVFHDARRLNDGYDDGHGLRGAELAASLRGTAFQLSQADFELLYYACAHHTDGTTDGDITVQTCWDADRLDLLRAGIQPKSRYLCTDIARQPHVIRWANNRSQQLFVPEFVRQDWGVDIRQQLI